MSESEGNPSAVKDRPLFEKIVAEEIKEELKDRFNFDPRMERDMMERNRDIPITARGMLLDTVSKEFNDETPASLVRNLEQISESEQVQEHLKATVVRAVFTSFHLGESIIKRLADSKGLDYKKIVNEGSWQLAALLVVARSTEWMGTHISSKQKVDSPTNSFLKTFEHHLVPFGKRKKVSGGDLHAPWGVYCELGDQSELLYPLAIGNAEDGSSNYVETDGPSPTLESRADALSDQILAVCNSYVDMAQVSAENGQPFGFLDSENRRVVWDKHKHLYIPIALSRKINGEMKVKLVQVNPLDTAELTNDHNKIALAGACRGALKDDTGWQNPEEITRALFAFNIDKVDRVMSTEDAAPLFSIGSELRPMGVFQQCVDDEGKIQTEYIASHTVADGMAADLFINGGKTQSRVRDGRGRSILAEKAYAGFRGYYNQGKNERQAVHINDENRYQPGKITIERCADDGNNPDVIITRTTVETEHGSDVMQSAVMLANEIFIDVAKSTSGDPIWNDIPIGANNTHASKDNPFLRLVPASLYRKHADKFNSLPSHYAKYNEVWSLLSSLVSYKENRWLIDNYKTTQNENSWSDHNMPASLESMTGIVESTLPRFVKRALFKIQKSDQLKRLRYALTYNQTVVSDKATNGDEFSKTDNSSLHKTVNNDGMPGVAIRQEENKLGIVFSQSVKGTLLPSQYLESYSLLTTRVLVDMSKVMSDIQEEFRSTGKINLEAFNTNLAELKAKNRALLQEDYNKATKET
ncbi:MAG: hypothetical protein M3Q44_04520 [bacterium]|nr:hypothetical protein [bacterium]